MRSALNSLCFLTGLAAVQALLTSGWLQLLVTATCRTAEGSARLMQLAARVVLLTCLIGNQLTVPPL
jgi:hypothetical protein